MEIVVWLGRQDCRVASLRVDRRRRRRLAPERFEPHTPDQHGTPPRGRGSVLAGAAGLAAGCLRIPSPRCGLAGLADRTRFKSAHPQARTKTAPDGTVFVLAVRAVWCEPVSAAGAAISLLNREKTGNFCKYSLIGPQICRYHADIAR